LDYAKSNLTNILMDIGNLLKAAKGS